MSSFIRFGLLAAALMLSPISPLLLLLVPLGMMLVALRTDDVLGILLGSGVLVLALYPRVEVPDPGWYVQRAWPLLLGGAFVAVTLLYRGGPLLRRSLAAVLLAYFGVAASALVDPEVVASIDGWMADQVQLATVAMLQWSRVAATPEVAEPITDAVLRWSAFQRQVYPALLGLASLPALALGWYLCGRLGGRPESPGRVRDFRFDDELVWVFVAGLAMFVMAGDALAVRIGANAALFMAVLYIVRGLAVFAWMMRAGNATIWGWSLIGLIGLLMYPFMLATAFVFGIGDTWIDIRGRMSRRPPSAVR